MYEVDFLPIEKTGELGSKSGDAIGMRFTEQLTGRSRVVVIDGGYSHTGEKMVEHVRKWYGTNHIDLMISTHPDQDHINGLATVMDEMTVGELLIHRPHDHVASVDEFSNIEVIDALIGLADEKGVPVSEPFTGLSRFGRQIIILGPTAEYYRQLVEEHLAQVRTGAAAARMGSGGPSGIVTKAADLLERVIAMLPMESLSEDGETGPRNNSSVLTLLQVDGERMLFTGDAGIPALSAACDEYEILLGGFDSSPLDFFQAPHHGSKRNLSPSLLDRMLGTQRLRYTQNATSFISSAKQDPKHPSPKVTNALKRRGLDVYATESNIVVHKSSDVPMRPGYSAATPVAVLAEDDD